MQFTHLAIENFGPFKGSHFIDLGAHGHVKQDHPIVLICGENGTGKTTVFEAVRIALHGRQRFGRVTVTDYENYIIEQIHKDSINASVSVGLDVMESGRSQKYVITRSWFKQSDSLKEEVKVITDSGKPINFLPDQYQDFVNEIVPFGLADLFFFDGERIQSMAEEDESGELLREAIRSLLGINITTKLRSDLTHLIRTRTSERPSKHTKDEIGKLEKISSKFTKQIDDTKIKLERLESDIERLQRSRSKIESELSQEGGGFAVHREELIEEQAKLEVRLEDKKRAIRDFSSQLLPLALSPSLCKILKERLLEEQEYISNLIPETKINHTLDSVSEKLEAEVFNSELSDVLTPILNEKLMSTVKHAVHDALLGNRNGSFVVRHDVSDYNRIEMIKSLDYVFSDLPSIMSELASELELIESSLRKVSGRLDQIPHERVLIPILNKLNGNNEKLIEVKGKREIILEELRKQERSLDEVDRNKKRHQEQLDRLESQVRHMTLAAKARGALIKYEEELSLSKSRAISQETTKCFKKLLRKQDLFERVEFDPKTYSLKLFDSSDNTIHKKVLSAGEKQILAISVLWALTKISGREIPVIIDTPLARLDVTHRHNLLNRYFPMASNQVIILATDSEVDKDTYTSLKKKIARTYQLLSSSGEPSEIEEGYFKGTEDKT